MAQPRTYETEFPEWPAQPWPEIPPGFADSSWRNDICPSLSGPMRLQIFCDHPEPGERELPGAPRYSLLQRGTDAHPPCEVWHSDSWSAIIDALNEMAAGYPAAIAARTMRFRELQTTADDAAELLELERLQGRPDLELRAHLVALKWAGRIGPGFHPDTRGDDYAPPLSGDDTLRAGLVAAEYEADMAELFDFCELYDCDPYGVALDALAHFGHGPGAIEPAAAIDLAAKAADYTGGE